MAMFSKEEGSSFAEADKKSLETISTWLKKKRITEEGTIRHMTREELVAHNNSKMKIVRRRPVNTVYEGGAGAYCIPVSR